MLNRTIRLYRNSFSGLSRDVWMLALVMLVNRSGTMVIPFMTVYLTQELHFTKQQAGLVMSCFGLGSALGTYLGGQLTDRFSYYKVQFWSLFLSGWLFLGLMFMHTLPHVCIAIFFLSVVAEAFRPANFASVAAYSQPENLTRSFSLVRLAINLGFSIGPALGGILAHSLGYNWLFIADGLTCIGAALIFRTYLKEKREPRSQEAKDNTEIPPAISAYRDPSFLMFTMFVTLSAIAFMQFFSVIPVYFREHFELNEGQIGMLLAMNGLIIALTEMPLVYRLEGRMHKLDLVSRGAFLIGFSFLIFNLLPGWLGAAVLSVLFITIGEMLNMPFANAIALNRSRPENRGQYMALYAMGYSVAHIVSPTIGMQVAGRFGFETLWYVLVVVCGLAILGFQLLKKRDL